MARARNIKPGFFENEELVELPFSTRLLFIGLWTIADRAGRLEDRPKRVKMALFPADNLDVNDALSQLQASGFILRYEVDGRRYIQILAFDKHQNPHRDEKPSSIPAPQEHSASTVQAPCKDDANPADSPIPDSPIPDSPIPDSPIPDSPIPETLVSDSKTSRAARSVEQDSEEFFEDAWKAYPARPGASKADALKAWRKRVKDGADPLAILAGVKRYAAYCKASETEPQYIKQPATFFGPGEHYLSDWTIQPRASPPASTGRQARIDNYAAQAAAARGEHGEQHGIRGTERDITGEAVRIA